MGDVGLSRIISNAPRVFVWYERQRRRRPQKDPGAWAPGRVEKLRNVPEGRLNQCRATQSCTQAFLNNSRRLPAYSQSSRAPRTTNTPSRHHPTTKLDQNARPPSRDKCSRSQTSTALRSRKPLAPSSDA